MKGLVVVLALVLSAGSAEAGDIQGKWGIGAGLFGGGGEISLIRGRSNRTAWLLAAQVSASASNGEETLAPPGSLPIAQAEHNDNSLYFAAGPGLRRYARPSEEFSPYFDLALSGVYSRSHRSGTLNGTTYGASLGLNFGLEYFTRWHFSVAAHTPVSGLSWQHQRISYLGAFNITETDRFSANIGIGPSLILRAYF